LSDAPLTQPAFNCSYFDRSWNETLAWLNRDRRLAKDFKTSIASAKAWVYTASVQAARQEISLPA
jgi:hypothetical protein